MKQGFTLLELSIVLVIIGLIIGGITVGQDLVRSAELQSLVNSVNQYKVAVHTFKLKFNKLPGDMDNAASYWPSCVDNGANTCNGNNNDSVEENRERERFWQHLSLAELVNGNYDGWQTGASTIETRNPIYFQIPLNFQNGTVTDRGGAALYSGHGFYMTPETSTSTLKETEMKQIDLKFDDGIASTGQIMLGLQDPSADCLESGTTNYDLTNSTAQEDCEFTFWFD